MQKRFLSRFAPDLPVTGAWAPDDPPGDRRFAVIADHEHPFALEGGGKLNRVRIAYETWGELDETASNAVLICHALTGDSHVTGERTLAYPTGGWWDNFVGPERAIDTERYFVVCSNILGGCQGTTGPADIPADSDSERPYGSRFPVVTIRDMVRAQAMLADHLGVQRWLAVIGGSMGGMQALEWAVMYPRRVRSILPLATCSATTPMQIAWSAIGRLVIASDPHWHGGDYYDKPRGPWQGLAIARELGQVTYRSGELFNQRFGRDLLDTDRVYDLWGRFQVESYLDHHGQKLVRRFDANTYIILSKALDLHDIGRNRGGVASVLTRIKVPTLTVAISSDFLYPPYQQQEIYDGIVNGGGDCRFVMLESEAGHDGFLLEHDLLYKPLSAFLDEIYESEST